MQEFLGSPSLHGVRFNSALGRAANNFEVISVCIGHASKPDGAGTVDAGSHQQVLAVLIEPVCLRKIPHRISGKMGATPQDTVELTRHDYHSPEGDLFIYIPQAKFLMAVDSVTPGYAPFQGFDLTANFHEYLKVFDEILADRFDTFVGGHLTDTGTIKDIEITRGFTYDVYNSVKRIHNIDGSGCG